MKIKSRLSLYFTLISSGILLAVLATIFYVFYQQSVTGFFSKLKDRVNVAAQLYLEADEITRDSLTKVREKYLEKLPDEVIRIYDSRNSAAFIRDNNQYWTDAIIEKVRKDGYLQYMEGSQQVVGVLYKDNQGNFVILALARDSDSLQRRQLMLEIMIVLFVFVSLGLFFAGRWFAQKALSPIHKVISQMQRIRAANLHLRVEEGKGKDEISALAHNFNRLLQHLENAFELQKTFIANASHELRTPVTSILGEVEVGLQKSRQPEEYQKILESVLLHSEQLKDTIANLMELAQVDMDFIKAPVMDVSLDEMVWKMKEYWDGRLGHDLLQVKILHLPEDQTLLAIQANESLLTIALNNIIGNAFKFSNNQPVSCTLYADEKIIHLKIIDKGIGIPEDALKMIFTPFYRGMNARAYTGNGIGLYVTHKIIELFKGSLMIHSRLEEGTACTLEFRRSKF